MRINKKFVPSVFMAQDKWGDKRKPERLDVVRVAAGLGLVSVWAIIVLCGVMMYSWAIPSPAEIRTYDHRCDLVAGKQEHYIDRNHAHQKRDMQCVVGPDWHRVDI